MLPPNVDNSIKASALNAWEKEDDLIYDFNVQSVITHPGHGELVPLDKDTAYTVRGYAYSGAGHKIKRVQVSLDGGKTWRPAQLDDDQEEEKYKKVGMEQGKHRSWCWRLWTLDIQISELVEHGGELVCRGWDTSNNTQPQTTEWNLMGMMHNAWYIVKGHVDLATPSSQHEQSSVKDGQKQQPHRKVISMRFEHPTVVDEDPADTGAGGFQNKGWLKPPPNDLLDVTTLGDKVLEEPNPYRFTRAMVAKHSSHGDAWVIVHNKVYDCSAFLDEHPGGPASILSAAGTDATKVFKQIHSIDSHEIFGNYLLGEVDDYHCESSCNDSNMSADSGDGNNIDNKNKDNNNNKHFLSPQWQSIRLVKKEIMSHDARIFRFALSSPKIKFGLPTGKHVFLRSKSKHDGRMYVRAYTPISDDDNSPGFAEFLIKVYKPANDHPEGGHLSQVLDSLDIGETIEVRGPLGSFLYLGHGRWTFGTHSGRACRIVTMAGGTGITPIYQLVRAIAMDPTDRTEVRLIYANKTEEEILLREELLQLEKKSDGRVKIWYVPLFGYKIWARCFVVYFYTCTELTISTFFLFHANSFTLSDPPEGWKGSKGHIDEKMVREYGTFESHETLNHAIDTISVMCGPPPMIEKACLPNIIKIYGNEMMRMRTFHF